MGFAALVPAPVLPSAAAAAAGDESEARALREGAELALWLATGYFLQGQALDAGADVSVVSCAMALTVVFSPLIEAARGEPPGLASVLGGAVALAGSSVFFGSALADGAGSPEVVAAMCGTAVSFSMHMVRTHEMQSVAGAPPPLKVAATQMSGCAVLATLASAALGELPGGRALSAAADAAHALPDAVQSASLGTFATSAAAAGARAHALLDATTPDTLTGVGLLAISGAVTVGMCQMIEMCVLPQVGATTASLVYASIPVWGIVGGVAIFGETLSQAQVIGGIMMVAAPLLKLAASDALEGKRTSQRADVGGGGGMLGEE